MSGAVSNRRLAFRVALAEMDFTLNDVASRADLSVGYLSKIINGSADPRPRVAQRIAEALARPVDALCLELD